MKNIKTYELFGGSSIANALKQDIESIVKKDNPLLKAIRFGDYDMFKKLLNEYNLEDTDKYGNTALLLAALNDELTMMKDLVKAGANISHKNNEGDDFYDITESRNKFTINRSRYWIEKTFPEFIAAKKYNL